MRLPLIVWTLLAACCAMATGCGNTLPPVADPERAHDALQTGLDAWKSGAAHDALPKRSPPIYFHDSDWAHGWQLKGFRTTQAGAPFGQQQRCRVQLVLQSPTGKSATKDVQYLVDTAPALVIARVED